MKHFLFFTAILVLFSSCEECLEAMGEPIMDKRSTTDFTEVINESQVDLELFFDENLTYSYLVVRAPENIQPLILTAVDNSELSISSEQCYNAKEPVVVELHMSRIERIAVEGSGDLLGKTKIKSGKLEIENTGSGDVNLDLKVSKLFLKNKGSGSITLEGNAEYIEAENRGSGDLLAGKLKTDYAEIENNGSGNVEIIAKESLMIDNSGSGDVRYKGSPDDLEISKSGSGKVEEK